MKTVQDSLTFAPPLGWLNRLLPMNTHLPRSTCGQAESEYDWTIGQVAWSLTSLSSSSSCKILSSSFLSCSSDNTVSRTCAQTDRQTDRQTPRESIPVNLYLPFAVRICFIRSYTCVTIRMCTFVHIHVDIHYTLFPMQEKGLFM